MEYRLRPFLTHSLSSNNTHHLLRIHTPILDRETGRRISSAVQHQIEAALLLLIDLSAVQHIDAAGLSAIYDWAATAKRSGKELVVCAPSKTVRAMLQLVRFGEYCRVAVTLAEAEDLLLESSNVRSRSQQSEGRGSAMLPVSA
jgi:anti-anti-sigma factor